MAGEAMHWEKLAELTLNSETVLYKQWLKGSHNVLADSLSRDFYFLDTNSHELFLKNTVPSQIPKNFQIKQVPKEIDLFALSMLQKLPETKQWLKPLKPSELAVGNTGILSSIASGLTMFSSTVFQRNCNTQSSQGSDKQCEKVPSLQEIMDNWWKTQSQPPSHMWHRPSGQTTGLTQDWTKMVKHAISCRNSTEDTGTKIRKFKNKKRYH